MLYLLADWGATTSSMALIAAPGSAILRRCGPGHDGILRLLVGTMSERKPSKNGVDYEAGEDER